MPCLDPSSAAPLFRHKVIHLLQRADLLDEDRTRLLLSWHHSGFSATATYQSRVGHDDEQAEALDALDFRVRADNPRYPSSLEV